MGTHTPVRTRLWHTLRRPRVVLLLLGLWAASGVVAELFTSSRLFVNLHGTQIDGLLAGRALSWQGAPLAVLYIHSIRDPSQYRRVFWIGIVEQAALIAASFYHLGTGDLGVVSMILPVIIAAVLGVLAFLHLYEPEGAPAGDGTTA